MKFVINGSSANLPYDVSGNPVGNASLTFAQVLSESGAVTTGTPNYASCEKIVDAGAWIGPGEYQLTDSGGAVLNVICSGAAPAPVPTYPGCDTKDIVLTNGQRWAACNAGARSAYVGQAIPTGRVPNDTEKAYLGAFYQWGRNVDVTNAAAVTGSLSAATAASETRFITNGSSPYDWLSVQDDNLWGGGSSSMNSGTFASQPAANQVAMAGPCAPGYHVPTTLEWASAAANITGFATGATVTDQTKRDLFVATLKLPLAGYRVYTTGNYYGPWGYYWMSSPSGTYGYYVLVSTTDVYNANGNPRAYGYSVRCLAN